MSNLDTVRAELRFAKRPEFPGLNLSLAVGLLTVAVVAAITEIQLLSTFSVDDFSGILSGSG
ncbi:MAG: hypothetical protein RQ966_08205 [Acetobacteraceae bacterium]|nr:hypothetical protein [Acetobacteraceae bacterium]